MNPWLIFVDVVRFGLFATAHVLGGSMGAGILAFSLVLRIALLPITIPAARKMRANQAKLRGLKPQLDALAKKYAKDPLARHTATTELYRDNGVSVTPQGLSTALVQLPLGAAILSSLRSGIARDTRFLWIRDLTRPDAALAVIAAVVAAFGARFSGTDNQRLAMAFSAVMMFFFAWRMSASVGLYSIAWSGVTAAESLVLSIGERRKGK